MWLFIVIVAALVMYFVFARSKDFNRRTDDRSESALDIIKKRYAKGEISKEEFERLKNDLQ